MWERSEVERLLCTDQEVTVTRAQRGSGEAEAGYPAGTFASGVTRPRAPWDAPAVPWPPRRMSEALAVQLDGATGLTGDRAATKTGGTKATSSGARDAFEPLNTSQAAVYRTAVGMNGWIVLDRLDCQLATKTAMS